MKRARFLLSAAITATLIPASAPAVEIEPLVNYEFVTGSDDYQSHSGGGGVTFRLPRRTRLSLLYSLFTDNDYSVIHTGTLRARTALHRDWDGSAALILSGGDLKDSDDSTSSVSLDFEGTRFFANGLEGTGGYRYTNGSLSSGVNREVRVTSGRRNPQVQTMVIRREETSHYTAHTLSGALGYEATRIFNIYSLARLALTFNSDDSQVVSEGFEIYVPFPYTIYVGLSFTLTQNTKGADRNYFGLSLSKYF